MENGKKGLPPHLTPGNPGNSGGKPGRTGRRPNDLKAFLRSILDHPRYQRRIMRAALAEDLNVQLLRTMNEIVHGRPAQKVVVEGEVDLLVQNAYPGKAARVKATLQNAIDPSLRQLAAAEGVPVEESVVIDDEDEDDAAYPSDEGTPVRSADTDEHESRGRDQRGARARGAARTRGEGNKGGPGRADAHGVGGSEDV
jgi:hypothetical protein